MWTLVERRCTPDPGGHRNCFFSCLQFFIIFRTATELIFKSMWVPFSDTFCILFCIFSGAISIQILSTFLVCLWLYFCIENRPWPPLGSTGATLENLCFPKVKRHFLAYEGAQGLPKSVPETVENSIRFLKMFLPRNGPQMKSKRIQNGVQKASPKDNTFGLTNSPQT